MLAAMSRVPVVLLALLLGAQAPIALAQEPPPADAAAADAAPSPAPEAAPAPPPLAPPPAPVEVTTLAAPDAFSTPGRDTGLPPTLWRGTSLAIARTVLPILAQRSLPPAGAALARRVLATGAPGPEGAGSDPVLAAARGAALITQGDPRSAAVILSRAPALDRSAELARVAAESALLAGQDARACAIEEALTAGRDDPYWLRLRAYCQAIAGKATEAQLTFDLAQSQSKDPAFARLMGAKLSGGGDPGQPSLRNGLDLALSRSLGLDLSLAKPTAAVEGALGAGPPQDPAWDPAGAPPDLASLFTALSGAGPLAAVELDRLLDAAEVRDPKARTRASAAALLAAPFVEPLGPSLRARLAALSLADHRAPAGRLMTLEDAAAEHRAGETALVALWLTADAGNAGLSAGDRAEIVRALRRVGLERDARDYALEGLAGLK